MFLEGNCEGPRFFEKFQLITPERIDQNFPSFVSGERELLTLFQSSDDVEVHTNDRLQCSEATRIYCFFYFLITEVFTALLESIDYFFLPNQPIQNATSLSQIEITYTFPSKNQ